MACKQLLCTTILFILLFIAGINCFEVYIEKKISANETRLESASAYQNQSYPIPLFQKRYVISRIHHKEIKTNSKDRTLIGYKYQISSTNDGVVKISKEIPSTKILLEDLYVVSQRKTAIGRIFNAYPTRTLTVVNQALLSNGSIETKWSLEGANMNFTQLHIELVLFFDDDTSLSSNKSFKLVITPPKRRIDTLFYIIVPTVVIVVSVFMGILLDPSIIAKILKEPKALLVGFIAQYGLMPFLAAAIAKLFHYGPLYSLALFVIGCCPGSGASNQWTIIFNGDVNLSAMMSFVSTASSFVLMPLYFYTLGSLYMAELKITVPFLGLARSLATVAIPYSIGIGISHCFPKTRPVVKKLIKPLMICMITFFVTFGLTVNWYVFKITDLYTALTAPLLPCFGYILGGMLAWMSRLNWTQIKTIAIEAGMQNTGIAFLIVMYSFPQPYSTQAVFIPMVVALLTSIPLCIVLLFRNLIQSIGKRKELERSPLADGKIIITHDSPRKRDENAQKNVEQVAERQEL